MKLHPLNHDFTWQSPREPLSVLTGSQADQFDREGYVCVEGAFGADQLDEMISEIDPLEARREEWLRGRGGEFLIARADEITFSTHLVLESDLLRRLACSPPLTDLCADLIGPDVRLYWDQAVYKKPKTESPFPWHQDNGYAFLDPQQYLTCWIALTDADESNGCPWVVPALHRGGTLEHHATREGLVCLDDPTGAVPVPASRGSIVVLSSLTPHCTGPNSTDAVRKAYIVQFAPEGAAVLVEGSDGHTTRTPADNPGRQFEVLAGGNPVAADEPPA